LARGKPIRRSESDGDWRRVESAGEVIGMMRQVALPDTSERRFFRLVRP
jgi:hypothetical protein